MSVLELETPGNGTIDHARLRTLGDVARYHAEVRGSSIAFEFEGR